MVLAAGGCLNLLPTLGPRWDRKGGDGGGLEEGLRPLILSVLPILGPAMPGPWLLLALALTLTVAGIPGGRTQPEVAQHEAGEHAGLDDLLRQAERLLLLQEDLLRLRGNQDDGESGEGWVCPSYQRPPRGLGETQMQRWGATWSSKLLPFRSLETVGHNLRRIMS